MRHRSSRNLAIPQRDARSLMELRRLALRAQPSQWSYGRPAERAVLHDALLETFPETYERFIKKAERLARIHDETYFVVFQPQYLKARWREEHKRRYGHATPSIFFETARVWDLSFRSSTDVIVYEAHPVTLRKAARMAKWYKKQRGEP